MIKDLVNDEATLSQPCAAATAEDAPLAQDLLDTLASLEDAVCLAANQIGVAKAVVAYVDDNEQPHVMYNPKILMGLGPQRLTESCLTHEGESKVTRFVKVKVSYDELVDGQLRHRKGELRRLDRPDDPAHVRPLQRQAGLAPQIGGVFVLAQIWDRLAQPDRVRGAARRTHFSPRFFV